MIDHISRSTGLNPGQTSLPNANSLRVEASDDSLRWSTGVSGTAERVAADTTTAQSLANKTLAAPSFTGVQQSNGAAGANGSESIAYNSKTLVDNTVTDIFTVTVPNVIAGAAIALLVSSTLGDGDSTDSATYNIGVSRVAGAATKAVVGAKTGAGATAGAGANAVITVAVSAMVGAVGAQQTFTITVKNARSAGAADNHKTTAVASLVCNVGGITIAAA